MRDIWYILEEIITGKVPPPLLSSLVVEDNDNGKSLFFSQSKL